MAWEYFYDFFPSYLWPILWSILVNSCALNRNMYSVVGVVYIVSVVHLVNIVIQIFNVFLIFCLFVLSTVQTRQVKSSTVIVDLYVSSCSSLCLLLHVVWNYVTRYISSQDFCYPLDVFTPLLSLVVFFTILSILIWIWPLQLYLD